MICSEHRAELFVEDVFNLVSQLIPFPHPLVQLVLHFGPLIILMVLN